MRGDILRILHIKIHNFRGIIDEEFELQPYTLLIGSNNAGKSTVVDAIRSFYEKDKYTFQENSDFPQKGSLDNESWIEITFSLTDDEYKSLADTYKYETNKLKVRKYFRTSTQLLDGKTAKGAIVGYKSDGSISNERFYGVQNVQTGKLGTVIYIPAISKVDDFTKLSGPSALRDLITNILSGVIQGSETYALFAKSVDEFSKKIKTSKTDDDKSLMGFESELNEMLNNWGTEFSMSFKTPSATELIKNMVQWDLVDEVLEKAQSADKFGSGFQRHFIYSIIRLANDYMPNTVKSKTKDFCPKMNLLLFEEPEAFLHPPQQNRLCSDLIQLSKNDWWQVLATTHSSHFVSKSTDAIPSLVHLAKNNGNAHIHYINSVDWEDIIKNNDKVFSIIKKYPKVSKRTQLECAEPNLEALRYFLCLNAERSNAFFASNTILVEGASEVGLINRFIADGTILNAAGVCVFDCIGKYNVHRFMNLFGKLGITHTVIIDDDCNKKGDELKFQKEINEMINSSKNSYTTNVVTVPGNLEQLLGIATTSNGNQKPQNILFKYDNDEIPKENIDKFINIINAALSGTELYTI